MPEDVKYPIMVEITEEIKETIYGLCKREFDFVHRTSPAHQRLLNVVSWMDDMPEALEE